MLVEPGLRKPGPSSLDERLGCLVMDDERGLEAVLIIGAYATGKTALASEIAEMLEVGGRPYAAIDLDWLVWADTGSADESFSNRLMLRNLAAVVANDIAEGVRFFVLAGAYSDQSELNDLVAALPMRLRIVRLTVPLEVIERRLRSDVSAGRHDALRDAQAGIAQTELRGVEDLTVSNDRSIHETATEVLDWLGWI